MKSEISSSTELDLIFSNFKAKVPPGEEDSVYTRTYPYIDALKTLEDSSELFTYWNGGISEGCSYRDIKNIIATHLIDGERTGIITEIPPDSLYALAQALDKVGGDLDPDTLTSLRQSAEYHAKPPSEPVNLQPEVELTRQSKIKLPPHSVLRTIKDIPELIKDKKTARSLISWFVVAGLGGVIATVGTDKIIDRYFENENSNSSHSSPVSDNLQLPLENPSSIEASASAPKEEILQLSPSKVKPADIESTLISELPPPSYDFYGIDFSSPEPVTITIFPNQDKVIKIDGKEIIINNGEPIVITFTPSFGDCLYQSGKACMYAFRKSESGNVIYAATHSGNNAVGQRFRHAVEGTNRIFTQADYNLSEIQTILAALPGSDATLTRDGTVVNDLEIALSTRISPSFRNKYYAAPLEQGWDEDALDIVAQTNPFVEEPLDNLDNESVLYFDTCGWKLPREERAEDAEDYSWAVYVIGIRKKSTDTITFSPTPIPQEIYRGPTF